MIFSELRHALRGFARSPVWTAAVVLTLALGVGANTTLFSYVASLLWPTIDAPEPHRLVHFAGSASPDDPSYLETSGPDFLDYHAENDVFSAFCASSTSFSLVARADGTVFRALTEEVYGEFFELFGARPSAGRLLTPDDENSVIVLGHGFWQTAFQGDPDVVGRTLTIDSQRQVTVVGIAPEGFHKSSGPASYYVPVNKNPEDPEADREYPWLWSMARLRDGVSAEQAQASMAALGRALDERHPRESERLVAVRPAKSVVATPVDRDAWETQSKALMGAVALFLTLACANVANLLLARALGKRREVAVRLALGADRWHLARRVVVECLLLALAGGALGVAMGWAGSHLLNGYLNTSTLGFSDLGTNVVVFDGRSALFGVTVALAAAFFFSLAPLADAWRRDLVNGLRGRGGQENKGAGVLRRGLVVAQVALSVTLLVAAGLLGRTLLEVRGVDLGFESDNLYIASFFMPRLPDVETGDVFGRIAERARGLPGVEKIGQTMMPPLSGPFGTMTEVVMNDTKVRTYGRTVDADYHAALGIELLAGRPFNAHDTAETPFVVLVNQAFADSVRRDAGGEVLGHSFTMPWGPRRGQRATVVGIVGDMRLKYLHKAPEPAYFVSTSQRARPGLWTVMMIRTAPGAVHPGPTLAKISREDFPGVALTDVAPFSEQIRRNASDQRLSADVTLAVAVLGLLLAVVGLGSVLSYAVCCRRQEIGLRMALGATAEKVLRMVLEEAGRMVVFGLLVGAAGALALGRMLRNQLYGLVSVGDVPTLVAVPVILLAAALAAAWVPARRAARIDPALALRDE